MKAGKEGALYKKYEDGLKFMVTKLDEFVMDCTVKIFEAEDIKQDKQAMAGVRKHHQKLTKSMGKLSKTLGGKR